jgi:two-component system sensor histidine kinase CreC
LLSLSALQRTKTLEAPELLSIETILEEVKASNSVQLEKKSLRLELNLLDNLSVSGDRFWFTQALQNVLQNAIEFSPPGGTITLEGLREGQNILIKVKDQGPGIPEWALNKVFDSFYSLARPDTKKRSSGLGLTIVSEIISLHDGAVSIANRQGGGAEVTFTIPTNFTELS